MSWYSSNPYQSFWDWVMARWKCPKCGTTWECVTLFDDCVETETTGSTRTFFVECPDLKCRHREILKVERLKKA